MVLCVLFSAAKKPECTFLLGSAAASLKLSWRYRTLLARTSNREEEEFDNGSAVARVVLVHIPLLIRLSVSPCALRVTCPCQGPSTMLPSSTLVEPLLSSQASSPHMCHQRPFNANTAAPGRSRILRHQPRMNRLQRPISRMACGPKNKCRKNDESPTHPTDVENDDVCDVRIEPVSEMAAVLLCWDDDDVR